MKSTSRRVSLLVIPCRESSLRNSSCLTFSVSIRDTLSIPPCSPMQSRATNGPFFSLAHQTLCLCTGSGSGSGSGQRQAGPMGFELLSENSARCRLKTMSSNGTIRCVWFSTIILGQQPGPDSNLLTILPAVKCPTITDSLFQERSKNLLSSSWKKRGRSLVKL